MFYREAIEIDFEVAKREIDLPWHLKESIENNKSISPQMVRLHRDLVGGSLYDTQVQCRKYLKVVLAHEDFKQGKTVYTEY